MSQDVKKGLIYWGVLLGVWLGFVIWPHTRQTALILAGLLGFALLLLASVGWFIMVGGDRMSDAMKFLVDKFTSELEAHKAERELKRLNGDVPREVKKDR